MMAPGLGKALASAVGATGALILGAGSLPSGDAPDPGLDWWESIAEKFGTPILFMAVGGFLLMRTAKFLGPHLIAWVKSQVEQSRVVCDAFPRIEKAIERAASNTDQVPEKLEEIRNQAEGHARETSRKLDVLIEKSGGG